MLIHLPWPLISVESKIIDVQYGSLKYYSIRFSTIFINRPIFEKKFSYLRLAYKYNCSLSYLQHFSYRKSPITNLFLPNRLTYPHALSRLLFTYCHMAVRIILHTSRLVLRFLQNIFIFLLAIIISLVSSCLFSTARAQSLHI